MAEIEKINDQEMEEVAGGAGGNGNRRVVANLQSGYLAVRTAPAFKYENEIQSTKLYNGDIVDITGNYVQGTGINGSPCTYVWVYVPKTGVSGYVNAYYIR